MGYRSNMYALVHGSDLIPFTAALKEHELDDWFKQSEEDMDEKGHYRFTCEDIKWYDGYNHVDAINSIFNKSQVSCLLRVGEEAGDEEYYSGNHDLCNCFDVSWNSVVDF